jgi:hypothetical protein
MPQRSMPIVVALGYKSGVGKDTVGAYFTKHHGFARVAFADPLKYASMGLFSLSVSDVFNCKDEEQKRFGCKTPRHIIQRMGDAVRREFGTDILVQIARNNIIELIKDGRDVVITDLRMLQEVEMLKELKALNVKLWHIERPINKGGASGKTALHQTEHELDGFTGWDVTLVNHHKDIDGFLVDAEKALWLV